MAECESVHPELGACRRKNWHAFCVFGLYPNAVIAPNPEFERLPSKLTYDKIKEIADDVLSKRGD